jgi:hypothetical protein
LVFRNTSEQRPFLIHPFQNKMRHAASIFSSLYAQQSANMKRTRCGDRLLACHWIFLSVPTVQREARTPEERRCSSNLTLSRVPSFLKIFSTLHIKRPAKIRRRQKKFAPSACLVGTGQRRLRRKSQQTKTRSPESRRRTHANTSLLLRSNWFNPQKRARGGSLLSIQPLFHRKGQTWRTGRLDKKMCLPHCNSVCLYYCHEHQF